MTETATPKTKVLIIEDNPVNAKLLSLFLSEAGFETIHAIDGHSGLEAVRTPGIGAVLLDRMMPDMDGLDVLQKIKLGKDSWNIPVIMLTAALSSKQIQEAKLVGAYDCLPKPYNREKIIVTLEAAIKSRRED